MCNPGKVVDLKKLSKKRKWSDGRKPVKSPPPKKQEMDGDTGAYSSTGWGGYGADDCVFADD